MDWWLSEPVWGHCGPQFRRLSTRRFLRFLHGSQLVYHLVLLVASIVLLAHKGELKQQLPAGTEPFSVFQILELLPAWLVARSVISAALSTRRVWLSDRWQSSTWEAAWCVLAMWLSTGVVGGSSLVALGGLGTPQSAVCFVLWGLIAVLLMMVGAHVAVYATLCLFFSATALTVNTPVVPLAQHWYDSFATSPSKPTKHDGLTPQQLRAMPTSTCTTKRADSCCAVCMDDVEVGQEQRELKCGHAFHQPCIDPWLLKRRVCPLCVRAVSVVVPLATHGECVVELAGAVKITRQTEQ